jgi:O-acetyl-ADP-ribose deacetylase (regulator of RNase III)
MSEIQYLEGDATRPVGKGPKVLVHICNDTGGWGKGFVVAISKRWKEPEQEYRRWHREGGDPRFELGQVQFVAAEPQLWVANLIGQRGIGARNGVPPVRYEAIRQGLERVAKFASAEGASVHMPRIGCGLAGGKWEEIEPLVAQTLLAAGIAVTVYDFK